MLLGTESELPIFPWPRQASWLWAAVLSAAFAMAGAVAAEKAGERENAGSFSFDIAPQPLEAALDVFSSTSNVQVLYETSLTSGRRSAKVQGVFTPEAALQAMLAGSGLTAWHTTQDSFSLVPRQDVASLGDNVPARSPPEIARYGRFLGVVQAGLLDTLCRNAQTRPGQYKVALRFTVGSSGEVLLTSLVNSSGDRDRDAQIIAAVGRLTVSEAPPSQLPQPITMVIAPRPPDVTGDCASADRMRANQ
ncbi:secretin and TonB N-terminal domain-containing protein [Rhodopseudomonas palustris]|nr:secretin and TonB N-terminal domain-containing protein [Rhodopseudomonas palustris]